MFGRLISPVDSWAAALSPNAESFGVSARATSAMGARWQVNGSCHTKAPQRNAARATLGAAPLGSRQQPALALRACNSMDAKLRSALRRSVFDRGESVKKGQLGKRQ